MFPFLLPLLGLAAPAAGAAAAGTAAAGAGLAAAAPAAATAVGTGLASGLAAGTGALTAAAPTTAAGISALAPAATSTIAPAAAAATSPIATTSALTPTVGSLGGTGAGALTSAAPLTAGAVTKGGLAGLIEGGGAGLSLKSLSGPLQMAGLMALAGGNMGGGGGGGDEDDEKSNFTGKSYDRGEASFPDDGGISGGVSNEWDYFPNAKYFAKGGPVNTPPSGQSEANDQKIISAAMDALMGRSPDPDTALMVFVKTFGEEALKDLFQKVQSMSSPASLGPSMNTGVGDGMSDSIPGMIDGKQPAALSQGEYVVPADVVSGLGNGSTDAGAQHLADMGNRVRQMRTGGMVQPPAINPRDAMPA